MRSILIAFMALLLASPAMGATIVSQRGGDWSSTNTWDTGTVPTASDDVTVAHYVTVRNGTNIAASTLDVDAGGDLIFLGTTGVTCADIDIDGGDVTINRAATVTCEATVGAGLPWLDLNSGTLNVYGVLTADADDVNTNATDLLIEQDGGTLNIQGRSRGSHKVSKVYATQGSYPELSFEVNGSIPSDATHIRLTSGPFKGSWYEIKGSSGRRVTTKWGCIEDGDEAGFGAVVAAAAVDSVYWVHDNITELNGNGTILLAANTNGGSTDTTMAYIGVIDALYQNVGAGNTPGNIGAGVVSTAFVDNTLPSWLGASDDLIVTDGIYPGATIEFVQAAWVYGADVAPATDESDGGNEDTANEDTMGIRIDAGVLDVDYAVFQWLVEADANNMSFDVNNDDVTSFGFDKSFFYQNHTLYHIAFAAGDASARTFAVSDVYMYDSLGPNNGNWGHGFRAGDGGNDDTFTFTSCGMRDLDDDYIYIDGAASVTVADGWGANMDSANFLDNNTTHTSGTVTVRNSRGYGLGEHTVILESSGASVTVTLEDNKWSRCGNAQGRNSVDSHQTGDQDTTGGYTLEDADVTFTATRDTVQWSNWSPATVSAGADTVRFTDVVFRYTGHYQPTTTSSTTPAVGGIEVTGTTPVVFDGCMFLDNPRRALSGSWNARSSSGLQIRGGAPGLHVEVRRSYFNRDQTEAEYDARGGTFDYAYYYSEDADFTSGGMSYSYLDGGYRGVQVQVAASALAFFRNYFVDQSHRAADFTSLPVDFRRNTIYRNAASGQIAFRCGVTGANITGNLWLSDASNVELMELSSAAAVSGATVEYNYFASDHSAHVRSNGTDETINTAETSNSWSATNDGVASDGTAAAALVVNFSKFKPLPGSAIVNFVAGVAAPDGSAASDAGAYQWWE